MSSDARILELIQKYDRPVPRYTSYPTAVQFDEEISQERFYVLLSSLKKEQAVSLYVHVPFCHILCHYCGCHTQVANSYKPAQMYLALLLKEIEKIGKTLPARILVSRLHFGGGSPNFLKPEDIARIMEAIQRFFQFDEQTDVDMEMDPRLLTRDSIFGYVKTGITRVSFGIQSFDPEVQKAVNRIQPFKNVRECVGWFKDAGIEHINFDLMYGLPLQTLGSIESSIELAVSLNPQRFAVFGYAHVPWMKKQQKLLEKYDFPDALQRHKMAELIREKLIAAGYPAIGIDHFAQESDSLYHAFKSKTLHRNFQGYTDDHAQTLIGFGVSSISSFEDTYAQNASNAVRYRDAVTHERFAVSRGRVITDEDIRRRAVIEEFMCYFSLDIADFPENMPQLKALEADGIITMNGSRISITDEGRPFIRVVASLFDEYLEPNKKRHAQAV